MTPVGTPETTTVTDSEPSLSSGVTALMAPDNEIRRPEPSTAASVVDHGELIVKTTGSATPRTSTSNGRVAVAEVLVMPSDVSTETVETNRGMSTLLLAGGVIVSAVAELKLAIDTVPPVTT